MDRTQNHHKIRQNIAGTSDRPRLAVYRSLNNIFAQLIDDSAGKTLAAASSLKMSGSLGDKAKSVGSTLASSAQALKITAVVFDRGGFIYDGNIKRLAESAREGGLKF